MSDNDLFDINETVEDFETDDTELAARDMDDDSLVTLEDEEGNELDFEMLDIFKDSGKQYVALISVDKPEEGVIFFEVDAKTEDYYVVDDPAEIERLFKVYKERHGS